MATERDVLKHSHVSKQLDVLECPRNAELRNLVWTHAQNGLALPADVALLGFIDTVETVEH